jgi:hypothetical protein
VVHLLCLECLELDRSVVLDLVVKVLCTQLIHVVYHIPCPHTFGVVVLDERDGVLCTLFLLTKTLPTRKAKFYHVA